MNRRACCSMVALLVASLASPAFGEKYYLYTPSQATGEEKSQAGDGVLVREVPVQKGDTLSGLSRKFSGKGYYYPQILLFNDIKNPNLIYAGDTLKVPVSSSEPEQSEEGVKSHSKAKQRSKSAKPAGKKRQAAHKQGAGLTTAKATIELQPGDLKIDETAAPKTGKKVTKRPAGKKHVAKAASSIEASPKTETGESVKSAGHDLQPLSPPAVEAKNDTKLFEKAMKAYRKDDCRTAIELFDRFLADNASSALAADASLYKAECLLKQSGQQ